MNDVETRVLELSYKLGLSHVGSCLTCVSVIDSIYATKKPHEPFVLSNGHAGLALYVVLEKHGLGNAEELYKKHGTHPNKDTHIAVSTGSLGQGLPVAVGMALADRSRTVYCMISDGECAEGSVWEALRIAGEQRLENLSVAVICNGYSAYNQVDVDILAARLQLFYPCAIIRRDLFNLPRWAQGLEAHYHVLTKEEYEETLQGSII